MKAKEMQRKVVELLEKYIQNNMSMCALFAFLVFKNDGSWLMCVESRDINQIIIKYMYLMPRLDNILDQLTSFKMFFKIDLKSGYYNIKLKSRNE